MNYQLLINEESCSDILSAFLWYESKRVGLGEDLELCIEASLNQIARNPYICQCKYKSVRVKYIERFPFGIHYFVEENEIKVIGVFHTSRVPNSWEKRIR